MDYLFNMETGKGKKGGDDLLDRVAQLEEAVTILMRMTHDKEFARKVSEKLKEKGV